MRTHDLSIAVYTILNSFTAKLETPVHTLAVGRGSALMLLWFMAHGFGTRPGLDLCTFAHAVAKGMRDGGVQHMWE